MENDLLSIVLSSGFISLIITLLVNLFCLGSYKNKVDRAEKDIEKLNSLSREVSEIKGGLERDRAHYIQTKSPWTLTAPGKALLLDSGGKDYIDSHLKELLAAIKNKNPKTSYDVHILSQDILRLFSNEDEFNSIKEFAYTEGIRLEIIIEVLGIYLRDKFLEKSFRPNKE